MIVKIRARKSVPHSVAMAGLVAAAVIGGAIGILATDYNAGAVLSHQNTGHLRSFYDASAPGVATSQDDTFCVLNRTSYPLDMSHWRSTMAAWLDDPTGWASLGPDKVNFVYQDCGSSSSVCDSVTFCIEFRDRDTDPGFCPGAVNVLIACVIFVAPHPAGPVDSHEHFIRRVHIHQPPQGGYLCNQNCSADDIAYKRATFTHEMSHVFGHDHSGPQTAAVSYGGSIWDGNYSYNVTPAEREQVRAHLDGEPARPLAPCMGFPAENQVLVSWFDGATDETSYAVDVYHGTVFPYSKVATMSHPPVGDGQSAGTRMTMTTTVDSEIASSLWLAIPVIAGGPRGIPNSDPGGTWTISPDTIPNRPCTLMAEPIGNGEIKLTWKDASYDEAGFALSYQYPDKPDSTHSLESSGWSDPIVLPANSEMYTDSLATNSFLLPNKRVCVKVWALGSGGGSSFDSNYACTIIPEDSDGDGFSDAVENHVTTNWAVPCGYTSGGNPWSETWPPDLVKTDTVTISDVLALKPVFNLNVPPAPIRYDLLPNNTISISDVLALKPFFNQSCVTTSGQGGGDPTPAATEGPSGTPSPTPGPILVAIDAEPSAQPANTATSLGSREDCVTVAQGATFVIDVTVDAIPGVSATGGGLTGFEFRLEYDSTKLKVAAHDYSMLLSANGGSLLPFGDSVPDTDGSFLVAIADFSSSTPESGEGVLARITLEPTSTGGVDIVLEDVVLVDSAANEYEIDAVLNGCVEIEPP